MGMPDAEQSCARVSGWRMMKSRNSFASHSRCAAMIFSNTSRSNITGQPLLLFSSQLSGAAEHFFRASVGRQLAPGYALDLFPQKIFRTIVRIAELLSQEILYDVENPIFSDYTKLPVHLSAGPKKQAMSF